MVLALKEVTGLWEGKHIIVYMPERINAVIVVGQSPTCVLNSSHIHQLNIFFLWIFSFCPSASLACCLLTLSCFPILDMTVESYLLIVRFIFMVKDSILPLERGKFLSLFHILYFE